jgi:anaerobic magnesium-protoporphyrin IX monomethyl ester cyclase
MRVELIHPPHPNSTEDRLDPPLGLLLIAAHLRKVMPDISIRINDMSGTKRFSIGEADYYGITSYCTSLDFTKKLVNSIRSKVPKARIIVGGANPSAMPEQYKFADYIVMDAGEEPMARILQGKTSWKCVTGIQYASIGLFPAFDLIDPMSYNRRIERQRSLPLLTSRGCPYRCAFCGLHKTHQFNGHCSAAPWQVAESVKRVVEEYGIRAINFQDDIFTLNQKRLFEILDLIAPLNIVFRCHGRAGIDNEEVYKRLSEAGCKQVSWGIESGSNYILKRMNKQTTVQDNYNVIQWAKRYGITARAFFVIGFPGETAETIAETKQFIINSDPDQYFVSNFVPYPGTPVWNTPVGYGIINMSKDFNQYYQVGKDGTGGLTIDTQWLSRDEFRQLEIDFRAWLRENKPRRGCLLDYEEKMEAESESKYCNTDMHPITLEDLSVVNY